MTKYYKDDPSLDDPHMEGREFEQATAAAMRTISRDHNMQVTFAGEGAKTRKGEMILPANSGTMTKRQVLVGRGFGDHESLHQLMTDFERATARMVKLHDSGKMLAFRCAQAIEDIRIENGGRKLYPGMPKNIDRTAEYAGKCFLEQTYADDPDCVKSFSRIGPIAITWAGRKRLGYPSAANDACLDTLPKEIREKVEKWTDMVMSLPTGAIGAGNVDQNEAYKGCHQGIDLAERLATEIEELDKEPPPDDGGGQGDSQGQGQGQGGGQGQSQSQKESQGGGQQGESADEGAGNGDQDSAGGGQGQGEDGEGAGKMDDKLRTSHGAADGQARKREANTDPVDPGLEEWSRNLLADGEPTSQGYRPYTRSYDHVYTAYDKEEHYPSLSHGSKDTTADKLKHDNGSKTYVKALRHSSSRIGVMRRKLERALMTLKNEEYVGGLRRGKLNRRALVQAHQLKPGVYRRKEDSKAIDTAVTILVDLSGSMAGSKLALAQQAAIALSEALEGTGVVLEVLGFNRVRGLPHHIRKALKEAQEAGFQYDRTDTINTVVFKAFDEPLRKAKRALGNMQRMMAGSNNDGESIEVAWSRLRVRPEDRHVMLVMSDGYPVYYSPTGKQQAHLRDVVNKVEHDGIDIIGIGIMSDAVKQFYPKWVVLEDLDGLNKAVLDQVAKALLGERFKVDNADLMKLSA